MEALDPAWRELTRRAVDLAAAGVKPGDSIQLRFDFGRDGCGGNDGWYVDNVTVSTCKDNSKGGRVR